MTTIEDQPTARRPARDGSLRTWIGFPSLAHPIAFALICSAVLSGLVLRIAAAHGDLWLDELWSLDLVSSLRWPVEVFWAVPHDNNHPLNSLWMAMLGPDRSPLLYRLPAILFGTATIAAAARFGWRVNPAAGVAAAFLTACAYPLVLYGSEARGYAGLILALVLCVDIWSCMVDELDGCPSGARLTGPRWMLAGVILFGTASHFTMLGAVAILGTATVLRRMADRGFTHAIDEAVTLFRPVLLLLTPFLALVATGALARGGFTVGGLTPFTPTRFLDGYGGLLAALLGMDAVAPLWSALPVAAALLTAGFAPRLIDRRWLPLTVAALVLLPAALFVSRIGNTEFPRYFLVAGLILPLLLAEMAGRLWAAGPLPQVGAGLLVALPALGQVPDLTTLLTAHRGAPSSAMALIEPDALVLLRGDAPFAASFVAAHYGGGRAFVPPGVPLPCATPPSWLIVDGAFGEIAPQSVTDGVPACPTGYALVHTFPSTRWSGRTWSVYRRAS